MWKRRIVNRIRDDEETSLSGTTWKRLTGGSIVSQEPYGRAGLSGTMWERLSDVSIVSEEPCGRDCLIHPRSYGDTC